MNHAFNDSKIQIHIPEREAATVCVGTHNHFRDGWYDGQIVVCSIGRLWPKGVEEEISCGWACGVCGLLSRRHTLATISLNAKRSLSQLPTGKVIARDRCSSACRYNWYQQKVWEIVGDRQEPSCQAGPT